MAIIAYIFHFHTEIVQEEILVNKLSNKKK